MTANQIVIWLVVNTYLAMQMYSVISRHEKNEKICKIEKTKNARMKRAKLLFVIVKCDFFLRLCHCRRCGC